MKCPKCGSEKRQNTIDSRPRSWGVKRTRSCSECKYRYPTIEIYQMTKEAFESLEESKFYIDLRTNSKSED